MGLPEVRALLHYVEMRRYLSEDEILPDTWIAETLASSNTLDARGFVDLDLARVIPLWTIRTSVRIG